MRNDFSGADNKAHTALTSWRSSAAMYARTTDSGRSPDPVAAIPPPDAIPTRLTAVSATASARRAPVLTFQAWPALIAVSITDRSAIQESGPLAQAAHDLPADRLERYTASVRLAPTAAVRPRVCPDSVRA